MRAGGFAGVAVAALMLLLAVTPGAEARPALGRVALDTVRASLQAQYPGGEVEVKPLLPEISTMIPKGAVDPTLRLSGPVRQLGPSVPVSLDVLDRNGRKIASVVPRFSVEVWRNLPVLARAMPRGTALAPADIEVRRLAQSRVTGSVLLDVGSLIGARLVRSLASGSVLVTHMLDLPPVVRQGATVRVHVRSGGLEVLGQGTALQDGRVGQVIRMVNPTSRKDFLARVRDAEVVELDLGEELE
ncbi:MAG: flagellar basal body P-ring formation chaperone FlgA [Candidatus Sericytochromatia bacterium]|nr:flagellar basal body P-ring formation chaperone FlgA [Candidatus Sericytochromatia bacterium]